MGLQDRDYYGEKYWKLIEEEDKKNRLSLQELKKFIGQILDLEENGINS